MMHQQNRSGQGSAGHDCPTAGTGAAEQYRLFVGVDVAAKTVTVSWATPQAETQQKAQAARSSSGTGAALAPRPSVKPVTIPQSPEGFAQLEHILGETHIAPQHTLVVMESTGAYWANLATHLVRRGYVVSVINALQAHHFAKALLRRAKTDLLDAYTLMQLAMTLTPKPWTPPPALYEELQQRLAQRDSLLRLRTHVTNQRHALSQGPVIVVSVRERLERLEQVYTEQIAAIDAELADVVQRPLAQESGWQETIERLQTIPGVGFITALWIVVATLNFTTCASAEQAAAYAGLAPMPRQSGTSVNKRPIIGHAGNLRLRTALYMATLAGARFNPTLQRFYERLRDAGKPAKVARCAVARKLLCLAWAIGTRGQAYDPAYRPAGAA